MNITTKTFDDDTIINFVSCFNTKNFFANCMTLKFLGEARK